MPITIGDRVIPVLRFPSKRLREFSETGNDLTYVVPGVRDVVRGPTLTGCSTLQCRLPWESQRQVGEIKHEPFCLGPPDSVNESTCVDQIPSWCRSYGPRFVSKEYNSTLMKKGEVFIDYIGSYVH